MMLGSGRPAVLTLPPGGSARERHTDEQARQFFAGLGERLGGARDTPRRHAMSAPESTRQIVVFGLGGEEYALTISEVQEIIRYVEPRSVSSDAPWILGVISLRGRIIPVCDLARRLGVARAEREPAKIVVIEAREHTVGLVVDDVTEVLTVGEGEIEALHLSASSGSQSIVKLADRLIVLLSSESIVAGTELADAV
jgi:purine-binding chemotaxis protein CheW